MTTLNAKAGSKPGEFLFEQVEKTPATKKEKGEKVPTNKYIVKGELRQGDKVISQFVSVPVSAQNEKQAAQYLISHARYLGFTAVPKSATLVPTEKVADKGATTVAGKK